MRSQSQTQLTSLHFNGCIFCKALDDVSYVLSVVVLCGSDDNFVY